MSGRQIKLTEYVAGDASRIKVDEAAGMVRGVKLLGQHSRNNRKYLESAIAAGRPRYAEKKVYTDHVPKGQTRSVRELTAIIKGPYLEDGELWGDLRVVPTSSFAPTLLWLAANEPGAIGLSHDAVGREKAGSNGTVIESIDEVHSVDLVTDPATVKGLFESTTMTTANKPRTADPAKGKSKKTLREVLTAQVYSPAVKKWLAEMDGPMQADEPMEGAPGAAGEDLDAAAEPDHGKELFQAICAMVKSKLEGTDPDVFSPKYLGKLKKLQAICEEGAGSGGDGAGGTPGGSGGPDDDDKGGLEGEDAKKEAARRARLAADQKALQEKVQRLERTEAVRLLCDAAKFVPGPAQLKALVRCDDDAEAKALLESFQATPGKGGVSGPRSGGRGQAAPAPAPAAVPADTKSWLESVGQRARSLN